MRAAVLFGAVLLLGASAGTAEADARSRGGGTLHEGGAGRGGGGGGRGGRGSTPVAWVIESDEYVELLRQKVTTPWDLKACGDNGVRCHTTDPDSSDVTAVIGRPGRPGKDALSALPALQLVQAASWMYTTPEEVPLRAAIANADTYPDCSAIGVESPNCQLSLEALSEFCIAATFEWLYKMRAKSATMLACAWEADAPARCPSASVLTNHTRFSDLTVGVLGYGKIGELVAAKAAALGATVVATTLPQYVVDPPPSPLKWLSSDNDALFRESDVIVETLAGGRNVVNATAFSLMKETSMLVGVGSDDSINYSALYDSLVEHPSRFAVVDSWQHGCWHSMNASCGPPLGAPNFPSPPELARLPNVLPLPGMAMRSAKWWTATIEEVASNLDAHVHNTPYNHLVRNGSTSGSGCETALEAACSVAKKASIGNCFNCVSSPHTVQKLEEAHCTQPEIQQFCSKASV
jgi:lactate dehydrogenase-like 2-hydroxyacid dehydrogenase